MTLLRVLWRNYLLRRFGLALVTLFGVALIVFIASRLSGDVTYLIAGDAATEADIERIRRDLGLDRAILVQFGIFLANLTQGDLGESIRYQRPVVSVILERVPATIELALTAYVFATVSGIAIGVAAARRRGGWLDRTAQVLAALGQSMPHFWIGIMGILVFSVTLGWLPTSGRNGPTSLIMPSATLSLYPLAATMRITRSSILTTLDSEYIRFLRVMGLRESSIIWRHALRNALIPIVAFSGIQLGNLLGGAVIVETVFNWPGIGSLMTEAIISRDYPVIVAGVMLISSFLILLNLAVDLMFGVIDRRVRYG